MVYFEELRLLILLVMAYFSYRKISTSAFEAIEQYGGMIEDEVRVDEENSQLEDESLSQQQAEAVVEGEEQGECVADVECPQVELSVPTPQCLDSNPSDELVPEAEVRGSDANVLGEVDGNGVVAKLGKRKMIKKAWRREKKESATETVIASEEAVESEVDEAVKEN
jgi:hypothetical protein